MMTEDDAKTKWCPMARYGVRDNSGAWTGTSHNRAILLDNDSENRESPVTTIKCIGSDCMMWRQGQKRNPAWKPRHGMIAYEEQHPADQEPAYIVDPDHGYCGLAGRL